MLGVSLRCVRVVRSYQKRCLDFKPVRGQFHAVSRRNITVSQTAAALRPIYFVVHPDLFGQHPSERQVNEESLKRLHEYVTALQNSGVAKPTDLTFYIRTNTPALESVNIHLNSRNLNSTLTTILKSFKLPVEFLRNLDKKAFTDTPLILWNNEYFNYKYTGKKNPTAEEAGELSKTVKSLLQWLEKNSSVAQRYDEANQLVHEKVEKLRESLVKDIGLVSLDWLSDWGINHCMACLRSFSRLCQQHPKRVKSVLEGRMLVFSNKTGVSLLGEIILSSEEVPTDWMTMLSRVEAYDAVLERLPYMEEKLSQLLGNIQIVRKKGDQILMAQDYELLLNKILNSLRRSQDDVNRYLEGADLSHLELSVEGESAPLTLSYNGQFLIPASIPGSIVVKFISENKETAFTVLKDVQLSEAMEKGVTEKCIKRFDLVWLKRDGNITPDQMISCCERLIDVGIHVENLLHNRKLLISSYYTVSKGGQLCIPWNWESDIF